MYELTGNATYDTAFELFNNQTQNLINVEWHRVNQNGRVKDPAYFSDSNWHCWDESHQDIDCP